MALDDLTPAVREEAILAGGSITPVTRLEYFLAQAASEVPKPSASDAGKVVTVGSDGAYELAAAGGGGVTPLVEEGQATEDDPSFTSSLTAAQIAAAFDSGTPIKAQYYLNNLLCYPAQKLSVLNTTQYRFVSYYYDASSAVPYTYTLDYSIMSGSITDAFLIEYTPST